jgi:cytidylate kinase
MPHIVLPRKLICQIEGETFELSSGELPSRTESLVVLGEAGMGKTTLLRELTEHEGFKFVTAARLIATRDPKALIGNAEIAVIDALDEATATREGESVDRVLAALEAANSPRFILACRVADWRSATAPERISEVYGKKPLEVQIRPLETGQASEFLANSLGEVRAQEVVDHFVKRALGDWLD